MNAKQAKEIWITDYLKQQGILPQKRQGENLWYCSPFRNERHPSFKVNHRCNIWYDHGMGKGGNILDLVVMLHHMENISEALQHLSENFPAKSEHFFPFQQQKMSSGITEWIISPLSNPALLNYLNDRCINLDVASHYCKEVHYSVNDKQYYAIGFENDSGGYELRNKYFKSCTSKNSTTFKNRHEDCLVFEGFIDFLSYLTLKHIRQPKQDVTVLNSVVNLPKSKEFLRAHKTLYLFLDNDDSGRHAAKIISSFHGNVIDQSKHYFRHKDLNDFLTKNHTTNKKNRGMKR